MMRFPLICGAVALLGLVGSGPVAAQQPAATANADYAAQAKNRTIKSLSARRVDDLRNGRGSGFAKAAEFNGLPGPAHLLELQDQIGLSAAQVKTIKSMAAQMKSQAIVLGTRLVDLEKRLNLGFASATMTTQRLKELLNEIAKTTSALRYVHLSTHIASAEVVTAQQNMKYARLRGYDMAAMPGHSQQME